MRRTTIRFSLIALPVLAIALVAGYFKTYAQIEQTNPSVEFTQVVRITNFNRIDGSVFVENAVTRSFRKDGSYAAVDEPLSPKHLEPTQTIVFATGKVAFIDTKAHTVGSDVASARTQYVLNHRPNPCLVDARIYEECGPSETKILGYSTIRAKNTVVRPCDAPTKGTCRDWVIESYFAPNLGYKLLGETHHIAGQIVKVENTLSITLGPPADSLFVVPSDYQQVDRPAFYKAFAATRGEPFSSAFYETTKKMEKMAQERKAKQNLPEQ